MKKISFFAAHYHHATMKPIFLGLFCFVSIHCFSQKTLEYNLTVGDTFTVRQLAYQHIAQEIGGVEQIIENNLTGEMRFEVVAASPSDYTLSMVFKRLKMVMSSPTLGELSNMDTVSEDSSDTGSMLFKGLLDVPVSITMGRNGKILSVTGGENLVTSMFEYAGIHDPNIIAASKGEMEKQFGSQALSESFEQMTHFYPTTPVNVGSEWRNNFNGNLSAENHWKLDNITDTAFQISGTASTTMSNIDENIAMTLKGNQNTTITANPKTGLFIEIEVTGENTGDTFFIKQNQTIPTHIKSTIIYKIII